MKLGARRSSPWLLLVAVAGLGALGALSMWGLPATTPPGRTSGAPTGDTDALAARADQIVAARVVAITPRWSKGRILSDVDVDVERTLKGPSVAAMTLTYAGGSIDGVGMRVEGAEHFSTGERALLLVRRVGDEARLVGRARGKLPIYDDGAGKPMVLWPAASGFQARALDDVAAAVRGQP